MAACTPAQRLTQPKFRVEKVSFVLTGQCDLVTQTRLPLDAAKKHEYVSFHSSGKINHPAKDQMPMPEMVSA